MRVLGVPPETGLPRQQQGASLDTTQAPCWHEDLSAINPSPARTVDVFMAAPTLNLKHDGVQQALHVLLKRGLHPWIRHYVDMSRHAGVKLVWMLGEGDSSVRFRQRRHLARAHFPCHAQPPAPMVEAVVCISHGLGLA